MDKQKTVCNVCGNVFDEYDEQENFGFEYYVGYGSRYDLTHLKAHICIDCFDKLMDNFIPRCTISPNMGEYHLGSEDDTSEQDNIHNTIIPMEVSDGTA